MMILNTTACLITALLSAQQDGVGLFAELRVEGAPGSRGAAQVRRSGDVNFDGYEDYAIS